MHLFVTLSLDGYFEGLNHDLSWHNVDDEFNKFAIEQLRETGLILFGRRTYQLMEGFWPKAAVDPIRHLKEMPGKDIWVGTSDLALSFIKEDLIDEFRFMINPVVVRGGRRIFEGLNRKLDLELTESRKFYSGNVLLYYRPRRKGEV
ncbi:dihydrofolate reductase [Candidatus Bathyarchaeota archaeon]|nr:MAG: dihydrofolate reductase [Candidatus Bathyarchaeota archaeon]